MVGRTECEERPILILDATKDLTAGGTPLNVWYEDDWRLPGFGAFGETLSDETITEMLSTHSGMVCIDIEKWPVYRDEIETRITMRKLANVVRSIHAVDPGRRVGVYSMFPPIGWAAKTGEHVERPLYNRLGKQWEEQATWASELINEVDMIFPSLYASAGGDVYMWQRFAYHMIEMSQRYYKPVYPFLWDFCTDETTPVTYFDEMLELCEKYAGAAVIWDKWNQ